MPSKRWLIAQDHQLHYQIRKIGWLENRDEMKRGYFGWAKNFEKDVSPFAALTPSARILEVGAGPMGLIFFLQKGKRIALDPLARDLHECFRGIQGRRIHLIQGMGEFLPFSENSVDLVILHNTIDHTDDPAAVLRETHRVLRNRGILYLGVNIYPLSLRIASRLYEAISSASAGTLGILPPLPIFRAHPRMFSADTMNSLLIREGFLPLKERTVGPLEARRLFRKRRTGLFWRLVSTVAYTGGFYQAFCRKKEWEEIR